MQVGHRHDVIGTDLSVRVRRRTAAEIAVSIERNDRTRYSDLAEHPLHSLIRDNGTDRSERNRALLLVLAQRTLLYRQRYHVAQRRRNVVLHHLQDAAILGLNNRLRTAGLPRRRSLRKQDNCDCCKAQQNAEQNAEFKKCAFRSGFLFHGVEFGLSGGFR